MGQTLLFSLILGTGVVSIVRPWIGVLAYYILALFGPQYVWWWNFEGLRVSYYVALFTVLGMVINILLHRFDFSFWKTKQNLWVLLLWLFIALSTFFGPYVASPENKIYDPYTLLTTSSKIFLFYFMAVLAINSLRKLQYLAIVLIITAVYFIYWANDHYFSGIWTQFNRGRLMGPASITGGAIYQDENAFAMLFVTGLPFLYFIGNSLRKKWLRYSLWMLIPLGWHAVFLTGSRGGLVGLGATLFFALFQTRKKFLSLLLIPVFLVSYQWQAGDTMKSRSETIAKFEGEDSAETRFSSWKAGGKMMAAQPLFGVGLASYMSAFPDFSPDKPRVAHNTLIQFAAESGVGAGLCYLLIVITFILNSRRIRKWCSWHEGSQSVSWVQALNDASTISFFGLVTCSLFLSLRFYEIFFYLVIINNSLMVLCGMAQNHLPAIPRQGDLALRESSGFENMRSLEI